MKEVIIKIESLSKTFSLGNRRIKALQNVELEIQNGEFIIIQGPSGSGKTTLLNLIAGLDSPTQGSISILGQDLKSFDQDSLAVFRATYIGYVFQDFNLISIFTVRENVEIPKYLIGYDQDQIEKRTTRLINRVGLLERQDHLPAHLSGGERQRVAFARALANHPQILLVDEPTANLDSKSARHIIDILNQEKNERTIIVATHDERIFPLATQMIYLEYGKVMSKPPRSPLQKLLETEG